MSAYDTFIHARTHSQRSHVFVSIKKHRLNIYVLRPCIVHDTRVRLLLLLLIWPWYMLPTNKDLFGKYFQTKLNLMFLFCLSFCFISVNSFRKYRWLPPNWISWVMTVFCKKRFLVSNFSIPISFIQTDSLIFEQRNPCIKWKKKS